MPKGFGIGFGISGGGGAGYDSDAATYFATVTTSFSAARKTIINTLVTTLKADGNWTKLDRLWLFANEASDQGLVSVVNPAATACTLVNSPTFTADQGFAGDGATSFIDSNFSLASHGANYLRDDALACCYVRTNTQENGTEIGVLEPSKQLYLRTRSTGDTLAYSTNSATDDSVANTDSRGLSSLYRTGANATSVYRNTTQLETGADASTALTTVDTFIGACNNNGSTLFYSSKQISIVGFGSSGISNSSFYTALQNYMTSLSTQV